MEENSTIAVIESLQLAVFPDGMLRLAVDLKTEKKIC